MPRKQKTIHYLYKTTCLVTNRYYIGIHSTNNQEDGYMGSGKRLRYSIRKYGVENHKKDILEFFESRELLVEAEINAVNNNLLSDEMCMNLKEGGYGGFSSEEHKEKFLSEGTKNGRKKTNEILKNKFASENWLSLFNSYVSKTAWCNDEYRKNKIKDLDWTGKKHSDETKKLMSEKRKNTGKADKNSQYGTCWITKENTNKKIKKEDLELYLKEGWVKGRKINNPITDSSVSG